jgi:hypothetical protein
LRNNSSLPGLSTSIVEGGKIVGGSINVRLAASLVFLTTVSTAACKERHASSAPPQPEAPASVAASSSPLPDPGSADVPSEPDDLLVVFPAEQAREFHTPRADDYWTPSAEDVRAAANAIETHLAVHAISSRLDSSDEEWFDGGPDHGLGQYLQDGARFILPQLATYRAQFTGVVRHGKRLVAANYVCRVYPSPHKASYWLRRRWHEIDDGGPCYFHFFYDARDRSIHGLALNGDG